MRKNYRFLLLCCLLYSLAVKQLQAQTNFRPGYVLPLAGDTLRGEVDSRDGRTNAQRCRFRAAATAPITTYTPAELRGYGFPTENVHYQAFLVAGASAEPQRYFLELLVGGPAALYFLRDAQQHESYYVASPTFPLALLDHSTVRVVRNGQAYTEEQTPYRNTLATALAGCPAAQSQLPHLLFQESALRKVVALYNACQGFRAPASSLPAPASRVAFGILAGAAQHFLSYTGYPYEGATLVGRHTGLAVGPTLRFSTGRVSQKLSLVVALLYEPEKYELVSTNSYGGTPSGVSTRSTFDLVYLRLPVMFRYTYPRGKVSPLAEFGFSGSYALKTDNAVEQTTSAGYYRKPYPLLAGEMFRSLQLGLGVGVGVSTRTAGGRAVALLVRAEETNGFSGITGTSNSVLHFYGLLSYDLTK